jgi:HK97 family phage prohead protease
MKETRRFFKQELGLDGRTVEGFMAYNSTSSTIQGSRGKYTETIKPWAFTDSIKTKNIRILLQHDPASVLGSTNDGNVQLRESEHGIYFKLTLPNNELGDEVRSSIVFC